MSKRKSYLLVAAIILLAALADNLSDNPQDRPHACTDTTHATCDGRCECDGLSCTE
jgi:hypothetical protein